MKKIIEIFEFKKLAEYLSGVSRFSQEITSKGLMITSKDLQVRLLIGINNIKLEDNRLMLFNENWKVVVESNELAQYQKYLCEFNIVNNLETSLNDDEEQLTLF